MSTTRTPPAPAGTAYRWRWIVLATVLVAEIMDLVDATIVNIAAPSIRAELGGSESAMQWMLAGYTLAFAIGLVTFGRLGDLAGRRRLFLIGAAGFTLASALCGLATSPELLIGSRIAQGLLGAVMIPQGFAILKSVFPPAEIGKAFALFGPVMGLSAVAGPIVAGILIDANWFGQGWRSIFFINIPIGLLALFGALRFMPELKTPGARSLDALGVILVSLASGLLIYPLVQGRELDWPAWSIVMLISSLAVFALFGRRERRSGNPVIDPSLFRNRGFVAGLGVISTFFLAMSGFMLVFNLFTQLGLHYSPLKAGVAMVPFSLGIAIGAPLSGGLLAPRLGRGALQLGVVVMTLGMLGVWFTLHTYGDATTVWNLVPATLITGIGSGMVFAPLFDIILASISDEAAGSASGVLTAMQQYGGAVGVAVLGTIFFQLLPGHAFLGATKTTVLVATGLFLVSFAVTWLLPKRARETSPA
ncbi:DHA2 family efflux MFS transporter permease subunit [Kribbella sandramycini]|uniref:DHA2 family efflux MFS transporter permease subunit n=1 Tax=Kribbella sandramycini TaxID=60450 RepID=A0A7Y4KUU4_9ACTN|nr:DHA2 family efflux MFS transporter permease subunit [Kribbella sandramycini]MBB6568460.1 EmrB/QacA subfamily drug resistance transporter [Kribbella sandramycini]NOL38950.1 DHA2 family efflux MFS transporter permease subunit [Kribbella sandramycini]